MVEVRGASQGRPERAGGSRLGLLPRVNPDLLARPRLIAVLDEWSPITILLAPSGAGKAVLATQWAAHTWEVGDDVIWLDGDVDDPEGVLAALTAHAGVVAGQLGRSPDWRRLRRDLQGLDRRLAVVVNNAEPLVAAVGHHLVDLVRDCRELHLVLCLRRRVAPVAKALLEAETRVVGMPDLQFTTEEVRELCALHGLAASAEDVGRIHAATVGWPALVRTGLESVPTGAPGPVTAWSPRHVAWFVDTTVMPTLPAPARAALTRAALVAQPTAGAVLAAVGPIENVARIALEDVGILDPMVVAGEPIVRLPPVLHDYLLERYDEEELGSPRTVHAAVVDHWLDHDEPLHALQQAVLGRCWPLAVSILAAHWWELVDTDVAATTIAIRHLPAAEARGHPLAEVAWQIVHPDEVAAVSPATRAWERELRASAERGCADEAARAGLAMLLLRERARRDRAAAAELADRVEAEVARVAVTESGPPSPLLRRAALEAGIARLVEAELTAAAALLRVAARDDAGDPDATSVRADGLLALQAGLMGDRHAAGDWLERWASGGGDDVAGWVATAVEAMHALDRRLVVETLARLHARGAERDELGAVVAWVDAQSALAWGGRSRVRAELAVLRRAMARLGWSCLNDLILVAEADLCLSLGRGAPAEELAASATSGDPAVLLTRARIARVSGQAEAALAQLDRLLLDPTSTPVEVEGLLLRAWCLDETDPAASAAALEAALAAARPGRLLLPFAHVPTPLLVRHARRVSGLGQVVGLLREAGVRPAYQLLEELPAITPREREVLRLLARGLSLEQIGRELFVSRNTVKSQAASLYRKLDVGDRDQAVRKAGRLGLLEPPD